MQQVVTNLQISQIELRSEDSFDIQRYVHERQVEKFVVPFQGEILEVKTAFLKVHTESEGRRGKEMEGEYWGREREGKYWRWGEKGYSPLFSSGSVWCGGSAGSAGPPLPL